MFLIRLTITDLRDLLREAGMRGDSTGDALEFIPRWSGWGFREAGDGCWSSGDVSDAVLGGFECESDGPLLLFDLDQQPKSVGLPRHLMLVKTHVSRHPNVTAPQ